MCRQLWCAFALPHVCDCVLTSVLVHVQMKGHASAKP